MKTKIRLLGLVMFFLLIGCNKDDQTNTPMSADDLTNDANMDEMSDDVSKVALDQYAKQSKTAGKSASVDTLFLPDCAKVTVAVTGNTWVRTIDFGTTDCTMKNGNIVKGKIIVSGSTDFSQPYTINCSFDSFYHNGNLIQGTKTMVRTVGSTANLQSDHPVLTMNIDVKETTTNGVVRTMTGARVREMVAGFDTPLNWLDDVFLISGNQSITSPVGTITSSITTPLKVEMNCSHIVQGVIVYTKNTKTLTLDYGDGTCDDKATTTINGVVKTIFLGSID